MSRKRGREEPVLIKPEDVAARILAVVTDWKDSCDCLFDIEHQLIKEKDRLILKLGFFDELLCKQIVSLREIDLEGDFLIKQINCNLLKNSVEITIARQAIQNPLPMVEAAGSDIVDALKLRVSHSVSEADAEQVQKQINLIMRGFAGSKLMKVVNRPSFYKVQLLCTSGAIPDCALRKAAEMSGLVVFDEKTLTFDVPKANPDILD